MIAIRFNKWIPLAGHIGNNQVFIRAQDGTETYWVAEWCDIITKVEDR